MTTYLVDLASYQHGINLAKVKAAGFTRVNVKLSEGTDTTVNPDAGTWIGQARDLGQDICTFHWLNGSHTGAQQAAVALGQMKRFGVQYGTAHQVDCEDTSHPATWAIWRDYVNAMQDSLGRHVIAYTGDWWWKPRMGSNNAAALTPYVWAAPNDGYRSAYPGDTSADWHAGYGGWGDYSALQYAVSPITGAGGGNLSKTAWRDPKVWSALTGVDAATTEVPDMDPNGKDIISQITNAQALADIWHATVGQVVEGDGQPDDGGRFHSPFRFAQIRTALGTPAPVELTDAQLQAVADKVSANLGGKLDTVLARLTAAGDALDG